MQSEKNESIKVKMWKKYKNTKIASDCSPTMLEPRKEVELHTQIKKKM